MLSSLSLLLLALPFQRLRQLAGPAHQHSRISAVRFWALDLSAGAGSISSPVLDEHYKNASEVIVLGERYGSSLASVMPRWLLLSIMGICSREITIREVRDRVSAPRPSSDHLSCPALSHPKRYDAIPLLNAL
ncbi:MAG: hypothetical protein SGPRY_011628, partial [Prymnesium sp.]